MLLPDKPEGELAVGLAFSGYPNKYVPVALPIIGGLRFLAPLTEASHFGSDQFYHAMWDGKSEDAETLREKIIYWIGSSAGMASSRIRSKSYEEAGLYLGLGLHTIQDSYSESHVTRLGREGFITHYQDYARQSSAKHGGPDEQVNLRAAAVDATALLMRLVICEKALVATVSQRVLDRYFLTRLIRLSELGELTRAMKSRYGLHRLVCLVVHLLLCVSGWSHSPFYIESVHLVGDDTLEVSYSVAWNTLEHRTY